MIKKIKHIIGVLVILSCLSFSNTQAYTISTQTVATNDILTKDLWNLMVDDLFTFANKFKFIDGDTSTDAVFMDGNVGIGTTNPGFNLEVNDDITIKGGNPMFRVTKDTTQIGVLGYAGGLISGGGNNLAIVSSGSFLQFGVGSNSEKMRITSTGNVGIGTTAPASKLSIYSGDNKDTGPIINLGGNAANQFESGRLRFTETSMAVSPFYQGAFIHYDGGDNRLNIGVHDTTDSLTANDTNAISILRSTGYVGIGTTTPSSKLHIAESGAGDVYTLIQKADNTNGNTINLDFGASASYNTTNNYGGRLRYTRTNSNGIGNWDIMSADSAGVPQSRLTILDNGNVGIGTTAPGAKLDIAASDSNTLKLTNTQNLGTTLWSGNTASKIDFYNADPSGPGTYASIQAIGSIDSGAVGSGTANYDLTFWTGKYSGGALSEKMRIDSSGNVGIGVTNPSEKLEINGNLLLTTSGTSHAIHFANGTHRIYRSMGNDLILEGYDSVRLNTRGVDILTADNSGNVGIGIDIPAEKLDVSGNVEADAYLYSSDRRLKKNIKPMDEDSFSKILNIDPVYFDWKDTNKPDTGVIAQDVEEYFPEFIHTNGNGNKTVDYPKLIVPVLGVIKVQNNAITDLRSEIELLKTEIQNLKN